MAAKVTAWVVHGEVERSGWCDYHAKPHTFTYSLYRLTPDGVTFLREVQQCDMR